MKITVEKRDLFTVPQGYYLAHCISADFALGAGIAKTFDAVYNMRFKLFKNYDNYEYDGGDALPIDNVFKVLIQLIPNTQGAFLRAEPHPVAFDGMDHAYVHAGLSAGQHRVQACKMIFNQRIFPIPGRLIIQ